jgi:hypothetical protein
MAGVARDAVLVLGHGLTERPGGCHLGHDRAPMNGRHVSIGVRVPRDPAVLIADVADRR